MLSAEHTSEGRLLRGTGDATPHEPTQTSSGSSNNDYDVGWEDGQCGDWTEDNPNGDWGEGNDGDENGYYIGNKWHSLWRDPSKTGINAQLWVDGNIIQRRKPVTNRKLRNWVTSMRRIGKAGIKEATLKAWTITRDRMSEVKRRHV